MVRRKHGMSVCFKSKHHSGLDRMWPAAVCQQRLEHSSGEGQETSRPSDSPITSELPRNKTARQSGCPRTSRPSRHTYLTKKEAVYPQNPPRACGLQTGYCRHTCPQGQASDGAGGPMSTWVGREGVLRHPSGPPHCKSPAPTPSP